LGGGFAVYSPAYHTSLLLILFIILDQFLLIRPGWNGLQAALAGPSGTEEAADGFRKRIAMGVGVGHLMWLIILVLMFWNQLARAF
jgi:predicted ferric reductase